MYIFKENEDYTGCMTMQHALQLIKHILGQM
jgi:hypothetical protein